MAGKRGRGRLFSPSTIRSKKVQRAKDRRDHSIFLGETHQRWTSLKEQHGPLLSHSDWAGRLLDAFESSRHQRIHLSSTPLSPILVEGDDPSASDYSSQKNLLEDPIPRDHTYCQKPGGKENFIVEVHAADVSEPGPSNQETDFDHGMSDEEFEEESELNISLIDPLLTSDNTEDITACEEVYDIADITDDSEDDLFDPYPLETTHRVTCADEIQSDEPTFLVFKSCLLDLASLEVKKICTRCHGTVGIEVKKVGTGIYLKWICEKGHLAHQWASQPLLPRGGMIGNINLASAIVLSGNNYAKIALLARFLNMAFLSKSCFFKIQSHYIVPGVDEYWLDIRRSRFEQLRGKAVIVAGDARMDSPGYCAKYCTYSILDIDSRCLLDMVVIDKRETDLKSTCMEALAFTRIIDGLTCAGVIVKEVVTDAHSQITNIMKKRYPGILHSYDVWHGAKNLARKLTLAAAPKDCSELRPWIKDITNHFWYCARECEGSHEAFLARWIGVIHHVTGCHDWGLGKCEHETITEEDKPYLSPNSPAHLALREVVYNQYLMRTIPYYIRFRSTSDLESFQNHILMYASKRFAFSYDVYKTRCQLAAIDYLAHLDRPEKKTADGQNIYHRIYSKITNHWRAFTTKTDKGYVYIPSLIKNIIDRYITGQITSRSKIEPSAQHPSRIRATTSKCPPEPTKDIVNKLKSRFK